MNKLNISFTITHPGEKISDEQIAEWLSFKLGNSRTISADNPLARVPVIAIGAIKCTPVEPKAK